MVVEETWEKVIVVLFMLTMFWSIVATVAAAIEAVLVEDIVRKVFYVAFSATFATISVSLAWIIKHFLED
jgi:hypothetical protein